MIKQLALVIVLILGIAGTVLVIQTATQFRSNAFDILDFVYSFHSSQGDPAYNPNLDINKDGTINTMDVLTDRYAREASRSAEDAGSADLSNVIESTNSSQFDPDHQ